MAVLLQKNLIPTFIEHADGTMVRCVILSDESLRSLVTGADSLVICAPGRTNPSRVVRDAARRLWELHASGSGSRVIDGDVEVDIGLTTERVALMTQDHRQIYAGITKTRDNDGRERSTAIVTLAPAGPAACDVVVRTA